MTDKPKEPLENISKRVNTLRETMRAAGLIKVEVWIKPEDKDAVIAYDKKNTIEKKKPGRKPKE
jgi:hypothetical protein